MFAIMGKSAFSEHAGDLVKTAGPEGRHVGPVDPRLVSSRTSRTTAISGALSLDDAGDDLRCRGFRR